MVENVTNANTVFEYTYSSERQNEVENIRKKYLPPKEDKMQQLRNLDKGAERPGTIAALVLGIVGVLFLGVGMCCTLVWRGAVFGLGIIIGLLGIAMTAIAYPMCKCITKKQREKVAEDILALSEELLIQ